MERKTTPNPARAGLLTKFKKGFLTLLVCLFATYSWAQPVCHAHFVHYSISNPDSVHFYIDSTNATGTTYEWTFGDGTTSNVLNPWHQYAGPGTYYACLTVKDSNSTGKCDAHWCDSVKVLPPAHPICHANFTHYQATGKPDSTYFYVDTANATGTTYLWVFGDGTYSTTGVGQWHKYPGPGTYYACLSVRDSTSAGICEANYCDSVHVLPPPPPPVCNAHFGHYSGSNPDSVHFYPPTNPVGSHYQWTFGDGTTSDLQYPWHFYTTGGTYIVCLTVTDTASSGVCSDHWCDTVKVPNLPPPPPRNCSAHFIHYSITSNCDSIHFYPDSSGVNAPNTTYHWTFGDGTTSTVLNPWHLYAPGVYYACLDVRDSTSAGICEAHYCDSIHACGNPPPPPPPVCNAHFQHYSITGNPDSVHFYGYNPPGTHYWWTFGDGTTSDNPMPWHLYPGPGSYYVCLTVWDTTSSGTCTASFCDSIHIGNPPPPPPPVCNAHYTFYCSTNNPDSVHFIGPTNPPGTHYAWTFGDGTTSNDQYPWHLYANPGAYWVCLVVEDSTSAGSCRAYFCDSVHTCNTPPPPPPPVCDAHFIHYPNTHYPDSVHFYHNNNPVGTHYWWDFGDGSTSDNVYPWHVYAPGTYLACLTVWDTTSSGTCTAHWCDTVKVPNLPPPPPPVCNAHYNHYSITSNPDSVHFVSPTNPAGTTYYWTFGDGTTSNDPYPWHLYTSNGTYWVCLVVEDSSSSGKCRDYWCDSIKVGNPPPPPPVCNAHFQHYSATAHCDSIHFYSYNPTGSHYWWDFGDGTTSDQAMPWHFFPGPGTYYVCFTVWDTTSTGTCTDHFCDSVKICSTLPPPPPKCDAHFNHYLNTHNLDSIHFYPTNPGATGTTYSWTFGDGTTSTDEYPWHFYTTPGVYYVCLTVVDSNAYGKCDAHWCDSVHVGNPPPPPPPVCNAHYTFYCSTHNGDSIHFIGPNNPPGTHYVWTFGDGTTSSDQDPWHLYANSGAYWVCLVVEDSTSAGSCRDYWCDTVHTCNTPPPPPPHCDAHFSHYSITSSPDSVHFYPTTPGGPGTSYYWTFGDGTTSTSQNPWHFYVNPGTYYACLYVKDSTSAGVCDARYCDSVHVGNTLPPVCNAVFHDYPGRDPDSIHFYTGNPIGTHYSWSFGDGSTSDNPTPWHHYAGPGSYYVCLTVWDTTLAGTCTATWCDSIHVAAPPAPVCNAHYSYYFNTHNADSVHFYSSNPTGSHYLWTFGDGTSSNDQYPWHLYAGPGSYYVCLTVWDTTSTGTCTDTHCDSIHIVNPPPPTPPVCDAHYTFYVSPTNADSLHFVAPKNPTGTHYLWTFGDGHYSTNDDPWHLFAVPDTYVVCLSVYDSTYAGTCSDTWCDTIHVNVPIVPPTPYFVRIYPNPMSQFATVSLGNMGSTVEFNIFDPVGHLVYKKENLTDGNFSIGTADIRPGIYFYQVNNGSEILAKGKLLIVQ